MSRNVRLYNSSIALVEASKVVKGVDIEFANVLLDKAQEYKDKIVIDEKVEKEVKNFEEEIRKGL